MELFKQPMCIMPEPLDADRLRSLLRCLRAHAVPDGIALPVVMRMAGCRVMSFVKETGISHQYLNAVLTGQRPPSERMRAALGERLGFDPWSDQT